MQVFATFCYAPPPKFLQVVHDLHSSVHTPCSMSAHTKMDKHTCTCTRTHTQHLHTHTHSVHVGLEEPLQGKAQWTPVLHALVRV